MGVTESRINTMTTMTPLLISPSAQHPSPPTTKIPTPTFLHPLDSTSTQHPLSLTLHSTTPPPTIYPLSTAHHLYHYSTSIFHSYHTFQQPLTPPLNIPPTPPIHLPPSTCRSPPTTTSPSRLLHFRLPLSPPHPSLTSNHLPPPRYSGDVLERVR